MQLAVVCKTRRRLDHLLDGLWHATAVVLLLIEYQKTMVVTNGRPNTTHCATKFTLKRVLLLLLLHYRRQSTCDLVELLAETCLDVVDRLELAEHLGLLELELLRETLPVVLQIFLLLVHQLFLVALRHEVPARGQIVMVCRLGEHASEVDIIVQIFLLIFLTTLIRQQLGPLEAKMLLNLAVLLPFLLCRGAILMMG